MSQRRSENFNSKISLELEVGRLVLGDIAVLISFAGTQSVITFAEESIPDLLNYDYFPDAERVFTLEDLVTFIKKNKLNLLQVLLLLDVELDELVDGTSPEED